MIDSIADVFFEAFINWFNMKAIGLMTAVIDVLNHEILSFFENNLIKLVLGFVDYLNYFVFTITFLIVLVDVAEEKAMGNPVDWGVFFMNIGKGFAFTVFAKWLALLGIKFSNIIVLAFGFSVRSDTINSGIRDWIIKSFSSTDISPIITSLLYSACLFICVKFIIESLKRFGNMFVHIFQIFLYIPDIMRGNTSKMGEWLRQMIAISLNYTIQYIMFFLGVTLIVKGYSIFITFALWISMSSVPKILNHFGWSSGTSGGYSGLVQTGTYMGANVAMSLK